MPPPPQKLSEIMIEMSERLLSVSGPDASSEAAHVALFFANAAWNESVGLDPDRNGYRDDVQGSDGGREPRTVERVQVERHRRHDRRSGRGTKKTHFPDDGRRILVCGIPDGKVRVEWLPAAAPGVDSMWEFKLYGLVRTGERACRRSSSLRETRKMTRTEDVETGFGDRRRVGAEVAPQEGKRNMDDGDSMWSRKRGHSVSAKSARQVFGLTQQEIIAEIRTGKLQFRVSNMHGNPWYRLLRHEVEALVRDKGGPAHLHKQKLQKELADLDHFKRPGHSQPA